MSELRVLGSAADLKFLHRMPQLRPRNFKSISGTAVDFSASVLLPKFAYEGAAHGCELRK
jgi:hypothetical protein